MENENNIRSIAHFDMDAFFVSVERLIAPSLKDKPLIVGGNGERGVVAACSYETRKFGVHSAMPMKQALRLCPHATVIPPAHEHYARYSRIVTDIMIRETPLFEKASIDEFYIDLTGMEKYIGAYAWATSLRKQIMEETGLPVSFALSVNKLVSKIAVDTVKPNGQIEIKPGTEKDFLAPMPIEKMPMVGRETALHLHKMGIFTIAQLADSSRDTLRTFFGKNGQLLWERAHGIDNTPVYANQEQKSLSTENTFENDERDFSLLETELIRLNVLNGYELRKINKFTCCIAIKIRYADFETVSRQITVPPLVADQQTGRVVRDLFRKFYQRNRPVRLLGVRYTHFTDGGKQLDLFNQDEDLLRLNKALDELKERYER